MEQTIRELLCTCVHAGVGMRLRGEKISLFWTIDQQPQIKQHLVEHRQAIVEALTHGPSSPDDPQWALHVIADQDLWRRWGIECIRRFGKDGPLNNEQGYAAYLQVVSPIRTQVQTG